jgi:Fic family protein
MILPPGTTMQDQTAAKVTASPNEADFSHQRAMLEALISRYAPHSGRNCGFSFTDRQCRVLKLMLSKGPTAFSGGFTLQQYQEIAQVNLTNALRELSELQSVGIVVSDAASRPGRYFLSALPAFQAS